MNREEAIRDPSLLNLYRQVLELHQQLDNTFITQLNRSLPFNEELLDRWKRAEKLGFGKESSVYDSALIFGDVKVGMHCWIGPYSIIDGSGGLSIGNYCTISAGVQIYTHDTVKKTLSSGVHQSIQERVTIGNNVYISPNAVITKGVTIGDYCVVGAFSLVNKDLPNNSIAFGQPAKIRGRVVIENQNIIFDYDH